MKSLAIYAEISRSNPVSYDPKEDLTHNVYSATPNSFLLDL